MIRAAAIVLLSSSLASAVPVDLRDTIRPSASPGPLFSPPRPNEDPYSPGCEIMATRLVINDLLATGEVLQHESRQLDHDALDLWTQWRVFVPAPSGFVAPGAPGGAGPEEARQMEIFGLHTNARNLAARLQGLMRKLEKSETDWWKRWKELDAAAKGSGDAAHMKPKIEAFKKSLEALAAESNALDDSLRAAQNQYDFIRPMAVDHLTSRRGATPSLRQPWHWSYAQSGQPRPDMRYDFAARYERHYQESHEWLRVKRLNR